MKEQVAGEKNKIPIKKARNCILSALLCVFFCGFAFAETAEPAPSVELVGSVTIVKIKLIIDGRVLNWNENGVFSAESDVESGRDTDRALGADLNGGLDDGSVLKNTTIRSFLSLYPGQTLSTDTLDKRCRDSEMRLNKSGYFYAASVFAVPPQKNPSERTVIVEVTSGYLWRYGGGKAWGMLGKEGLGGERASFRLYAGWNKNGAAYLHERIGGIPLVLGANLYYFGPGDYQAIRGNKNVNRFESVATVGWYVNPDTLVGVDVVSQGFSLKDGGLVFFQPFIRLQKYLEPGVDSDAGIALRGFWYPELRTAKAEIQSYAHAGLSESTVIAFAGSAGATLVNTEHPVGFDLFYADDRNVRSGYSANELSARDYILGSAEVRQTLFNFIIPPAINCKIHVFAFTDIAGIRAMTDMNPTHVADAYGGGLRILLDNPIFASFEFSYGVNREGKGRFLFSGTAGY